MTQSAKKILYIVFCTAMAIALALSCLFAQASAATDFSRKGYSVKTVGGAEFLREELKQELSDGELRYLQNNDVFSLKYSDNVPSSYVMVALTDNGVTVAPKAYSYLSDSGQPITWSPVSVNGVTIDGEITLPQVAEDYVTVLYQTHLTVDKQAVNALLNSYYYAAKAQSERFAQHNKEVADYNAYLAALQEYNDVLLPQYRQYLSDYADWKRKDDPYQAYLADYQTYLAELDAYNNYDYDKAQEQYQADMQRYQQYLSDMEQYDKLYEQYRQALESPDLVKMRNQLATLQYMSALCQGRSLRSAIMGNTVTQVLEHSGEIKTYLAATGLDKSAVDKARRATSALRDLISNYEQCTTDEQRYGVYASTYTQLKENFERLLRCLDYFYRDNFIRGQIQKQGKDLPYRILLAQLYEICNALDDETIENYEQCYLYNNPNASFFGSGYKISGQTPEQILGDCLLEDVNDALPLENGVPYIPAEPPKPQEMTKPDIPERPQRPVAPEVVPPPGPAPQVVLQPQLPSVTAEPSPYAPTADEQAMQQAFDNGEIELREELSTDREITVTTQVIKYFRNVEQVTVFFHASENADPYPVEGERNTYIEYPSELELPTKTRTGHTCIFDGWTYEDGTDVDWHNMRDGSELHLYPKFVETPNMYEVIWIVDGVQTVTHTPYGQIPVFDGIPAKADDPDGRQYRFTSWDRPLVPMTDQTAIYKAQFEASVLITWDVDGKTDVTSVWKGDVPAYPYGTPLKDPGKTIAYLFDKWDRPVTEAVSDTVYTAKFNQSVILSVEGRPSAVTLENDCYTAVFSTSSQQNIDLSVLVRLAEERNAAIALSCNSGAVVLHFAAEDVYALKQNEAVFYTFACVQTGVKEYAYRLDLYDGEQRPLSGEYTARVTVKGSFSATNSMLFRQEDNTQIRLTIKNNFAEFSMRANSEYQLLTRYGVTVAADSQNVLTASLSTNLRPGMKITLYTSDVPGKKLERIYAEDAEGNAVAITDNGFVMPESDVTIYAILSDIYYTVTFKADGKTLQTRTYRYGETVVPPANPVKAPDDKNSYVFDGWDKPLSPVSGDVEYNAVFKATPLEDLTDGELSSAAKALITFAAIGFAVVVALAIALPVVIRRKRKKRLASQTDRQARTDASDDEQNGDNAPKKQ